MAKRNPTKKKFNNQRNGKKSYGKKPNRYLKAKRQIERNKESEELLRRQQLGKFKKNMWCKLIINIF